MFHFLYKRQNNINFIKGFMLLCFFVFFIYNYNSPSSSWASSDIIERSHSGSNTRLTTTDFTPSTDSIFILTSSIMNSAAGQLGAVRVISSVTSPLLASMR